MPQVTLRQIAEKVGCSRSTVSYALRNSPYISKKMRDNVVEVAKTLGWRPDVDLNIQMASVRKSSTQKLAPTIAIIVNTPKNRLSGNSAPALQIDGIRRRADELGFAVDEFNLADEPLSPSRLKGILEARQIRGIVYLGTIIPPLPEEFLLIGKGFTCSVCGVRYPKVPFHVTVPDFLAAGRMAIRRMLKSGFQRPAVFLSSPIDEPLDWAFSGGAFAGLLDVRETDRLPIQYFDPWDENIDSKKKTLLTWIEENKPDTLLCLDVALVKEVLSLSKHEWVQALPCFSYDWYPEQNAMGGIDLMQRDVGKVAVDLVFDQLSKGQVGIPEFQQSVNIEGVWATEKSYEESHFYHPV